MLAAEKNGHVNFVTGLFSHTHMLTDITFLNDLSHSNDKIANL